MTYLDYNQNRYFTDLNEDVVRVSSDFADRHTHFLRLSEEQEAYRLANMGAKPYDVWHMTERTTPVDTRTAAELREQEYRRRIPRDKLDAYATYVMEGKTEQANLIAAEIVQIKNKIREMFPDEMDEYPPNIE